MQPGKVIPMRPGRWPVPQRMWRGMGQLLEGCVPEGSQLSWTGNLNAQAYGFAPPIGHVIDDCASGQPGTQCSLKAYLEAYGFTFVSVEWLWGVINVGVRVRVITRQYFDSKEDAGQRITDALNGIADAQMAEIRIEVKPEPCPSVGADVPAQPCPSGYYTDQGGCKSIPSKRRKVRGSSFVDDGSGWAFDWLNPQGDYTATSEPSAPAQDYSQSLAPVSFWSGQTQTPQTQTQTPSDDGAPKASIPAWVWLVIIGVGVFAFAES